MTFDYRGYLASMAALGVAWATDHPEFDAGAGGTTEPARLGGIVADLDQSAADDGPAHDGDGNRRHVAAMAARELDEMADRYGIARPYPVRGDYASDGDYEDAIADCARMVVEGDLRMADAMRDARIASGGDVDDFARRVADLMPYDAAYLADVRGRVATGR